MRASSGSWSRYWGNPEETNRMGSSYQ
jgi:hypothetical protein